MNCISHRGIFDTKETSIKSIKKCIENNISIEIDLRIKNDDVYVSHDINQPELFFEDVCSCLMKSKTQNAFHIKEHNVINPALKILRRYKIDNYFMFSTDNHILEENGVQNIARYVNTQENAFNQILWCDESIKNWFNPGAISNLKNKKNHLIAISLEILTDCSVDNSKSYWDSLYKMGFDGICTDYPKECKSFFMGLGE